MSGEDVSRSICSWWRDVASVARRVSFDTISRRERSCAPREDRSASDIRQVGDGNFTTGMENRETHYPGRGGGATTTCRTECRSAVPSLFLTCQPRYPPAASIEKRRSRCNCVNCTTHMIRIAFNYSSICEILSPYPPFLFQGPLFPPLYARRHGVRAHSMVMKMSERGRDTNGEPRGSPKSKTCLRQASLCVIRVSCTIYLLFISYMHRIFITKSFDLPKYLYSRKLGHLQCA